MTTTTHVFTRDDIGCYFDGARGIYIGEAIQEWAGRIGLERDVAITVVPCHHDGIHSDGYDSGISCPCPGIDDHDDWYNGSTSEAEDFLNTLTADDVSFSSTESGDWGLWHLCDDEMECDFCSYEHK